MSTLLIHQNKLVGIMYLENNFSMQATQCTLTLQQEIVECRGAEEAAQPANFTRSTFLANMSHELRSPLNAIHQMTVFFI
ncbi:histidine kinase dimerization/phospho-acceptor domain-containing protein [Scytonema sp. NUACC26]|uniref:histidine kinase dimerization/phospho-acceptor domain-containing protein n=1 Tax=Scytonema sp. NUACC26 TaxID=3140176 RepID=UPI0034DC2607